MSDKEAPIIIKRVKKVKHAGHHGGSWKIAYADFVTAMMAFFLIMWILSMLNKSQLKSVADYFEQPKKYGMVKEGSRVNKDQVQDSFLEKGVQKGVWKDVNKDKKKEDAKVVIPPQVKTTQTPANTGTTGANTKPSKEKQLDSQQQQMEQMKRDLEKKLADNPQLSQYKNQLNFVVTADGLKIVLKDLDKKPMFSSGKADFQKYAANIVTWLSNQLDSYPNQVVIVGHTDNDQFKSANYTNWELSADRANATRRVLIDSGMSANKIIRIIGEADKIPLNKQDGSDPSNRRIDIIVLTNQAAKKLLDSK